MVDRLVVQGAREHNLTGVDLDLPRDSLVVFTGLSGSGKSSLAFDTIFAEGQRRYVESLSAYARQFLGQMDKPDVDFIEGLSPAVSIDQKSTSRNPRSTVGTITEVYDYLRLLYARAGTPHCPICGEIISKQTPAADRRPGARHGAGPALPGARPGHPRPQGRVRRPVQPAPGAGLLPRAGRRHGASAVRAADAEEAGEARHLGRGRPAVGEVERQAAPHRLGRDRRCVSAEGIIVLEFVDLPEDDPDRERRFSERMACPNGHQLAVDDLEPRAFSFNSPYGACTTCTGLGHQEGGRPGAARARRRALARRRRHRPLGHRPVRRVLHPAARRRSPSRSASAWTRRGASCSARVQKAVLHGRDDQVHVRYRNRYGRERSYYATFEGVVPFLERRLDQTESDSAARALRGLHARRAVPGLRGRRGSSRRSSR